jgi:hypothetical protein
MSNTMKNLKIFNQKEVQPQLLSGKYSEVMRWMGKMLLSKNLLTKEQSTKEPKAKQDNTIEVMFLKRSNPQPLNDLQIKSKIT